MEEKKPLDSRSLSHTSKEPEAQLWAKIGTSSYDPSIKPAQAIASEKNSAPTNDNGAQEATEATQEPQEETKTDTDAQAEEKKAETLPKRKSNTLGDGFDANGSEEKKESRSRSRSRSRERRRRSRSPPDKRHDYSTSSMNQKDIKSRIFIGHLNTTECTKKDVEEVFGPYGKINGINLQNGYGFVQYENEDSVKEAIKKCHNTTFMGSKIGKRHPPHPPFQNQSMLESEVYSVNTCIMTGSHR